MNRCLFVGIVGLLLCACSSRYATNGEHLYLKSRNGENLIINPPLSSSNVSHAYDLPPQQQDAQVDITPPVE